MFKEILDLSVSIPGYGEDAAYCYSDPLTREVTVVVLTTSQTRIRRNINIVFKDVVRYSETALIWGNQIHELDYIPRPEQFLRVLEIIDSSLVEKLCAADPSGFYTNMHHYSLTADTAGKHFEIVAGKVEMSIDEMADHSSTTS